MRIILANGMKTASGMICGRRARKVHGACPLERECNAMGDVE